jgi:Putative addiction module component
MGDPARKPAPDDPGSDPLEEDDGWEDEINRRIEEVRTGQVELVDWEDVRAEIDARLAAIAKARGATPQR